MDSQCQKPGQRALDHTFHWCAVPLCRNTSIHTPEKLFINVPKDAKRRTLWMQAARRDSSDLSPTSVMYMCEDHFNLESDMENYVRFQLIGGPKQMKRDVVPHRFECQHNAQPQYTHVVGQYRGKKGIAEYVLSTGAYQPVKHQTNALTQGADQQMEHQTDVLLHVPDQTVEQAPDDISYVTDRTVEQQPDAVSQVVYRTVKQEPDDTSNVSDRTVEQQPDAVSHITDQTVQQQPLVVTSTVVSEMQVRKPFVVERAVQVRMIPKRRSKGQQCWLNTNVPKFLSESEHPPMKIAKKEASTTTTKRYFGRVLGNPTSKSSAPMEDAADEHGDSFVFTDTAASASGYQDHWKTLGLGMPTCISVECTMLLILAKPRFYIGIPEDCKFVLNLLQAYTDASMLQIFLVLKKIRTDESFAVLADDFDVTESQAFDIFQTFLPKISACMKQLILSPSSDSIKRMLPLAFRTNYSDVQYIIDCLEIEIEKPSDPVKQALTWSNYENCNTLKFLMSSTPDGIFNFVSCGYGGWTSDVFIVKESGFLNQLRCDAAVMAVRGFTLLENHLIGKHCKLVRLPSVDTSSKLSTIDVSESKRIASLRIHIENAIRRLREFKILTPHSCIDRVLVQSMDQVLITACGLANLHGSLI